jgi:hypothetical protein
MRNGRLDLLLVLLLALCAGCAGQAAKVAKPAQPALESVRLAGNRICGSQASTAAPSTYTFECPPLPATAPSGWRLTPATQPAEGNPARVRANRTAVINVSGPLSTELDVELVRGGTQLNLPLETTRSGTAGVPGEVAASRQVGLTTFDEGGKRMWLIEVVVSSCADARHLQIFNRTAKEAERSKPLEVYLLRDPADQVCVGQSGPNPAIHAGIGDPINPRAAGGCAGGGTGKAFQFCETCPELQPAALSVYATGNYCSWDEVLEVYGYAGKDSMRAQLCKLSQVGSREVCEGRQ